MIPIKSLALLIDDVIQNEVDAWVEAQRYEKQQDFDEDTTSNFE